MNVPKIIHSCIHNDTLYIYVISFIRIYLFPAETKPFGTERDNAAHYDAAQLDIK